jgi:hypothetical protein
MDNKSVEKKGRDFWGPSEWKSIHSKCAVYKPESAAAFKKYINSLPDILPCEDCGKHFKKNLEKYPLDTYLGNNHDLFFWSYLIHDVVNQQITEANPSKPPKISPPFDKVKAYYFRGLGEDCKVCNKV